MRKNSDIIDFDLDNLLVDEDEEYHEENPKKHRSAHSHNHRLRVKRRMDDYEEHLWKKRNGWYDDELYSAFSEDLASRG